MKDDGGPAFPVPMNIESWGMSLRDYFAAMALQGMCASAELGKHNLDDCPVIAMAAYRYADAMLAERSKGK